jgi:Tfp pilus assembly protein PilO
MTRRDRLVIVAVAVVAAIAASWFLLISPKRDQASKLGAKVAAAQGQLDAARSELAQNAVASKQYASNAAALARLGQAVPATDEVPSLIFELQSAADGARVDFQSLQNGNSSAGGASAPAAPTTTPATGTGTATPSTFTFTFSGTYFQLSSFFDRLQRFVVTNGNGVVVRGRLITLNSVNLTPASGGFPQINASISATTYVEPAPQVSSAAASSASSTASTGAQAASTSPSTTPAPTAAISSPIR